MSKQSKNKTFVERVNQYDSPMDFDATWASLDQRRKKKKRGGFLHWYLLGLGVLAITASFIYFQKNVKHNIYSATVIKKTDTEKEIIHSFPAKHTSPKTKSLDQSRKSNTKNESGQSAPKTQKKEVFLKNSFYSSENKNSIQNFQHNNNPTQHSKSNAFATQNNQKTINKITNKISLKRTHDTFNKTADQSLLNESSQIKPLSFTANTSTIQQHSIVLKNYPKPKLNKWSISLATGYAISDKSILAGSSSTEDYANFRSNSESSLDMISGAVLIHHQINNHLVLTSGIQFQNFTDRFNDQYQTTSTQVFEDQIIEIITMRNGSTNSIRGSVQGTIDSTFLITRYNTTQQISIPLEIGLRFPIHNQFYSTISGGVAVGIFNRSSGIIFDEQMQSGQYVQLADFSQSNLSLSQANLSIGLGWQFAQNWTVESRLYGGTHLSGLKNNINDIEEKYKWIGVNLGVRYIW